MQGRTVIAIAHRLATLKSFDRIIVMDRGRIVDDGPPRVLALRPGPYRDMLRKQQLVSRCPKLHSLTDIKASRAMTQVLCPNQNAVAPSA